MRRDENAEYLFCEDNFKFTDKRWMAHRAEKFRVGKNSSISEPINIYKADLRSFMLREDGSCHSYSEYSNFLPSYLKKMGYTHLELVSLDGISSNCSSKVLAESSSLRQFHELSELINALHNAGVGVILNIDAIKAYADEGTQHKFEPSSLFRSNGGNNESADIFFDILSAEVRSFLISFAVYCLKVLHVDGFRIKRESFISSRDGVEHLTDVQKEEGAEENRELLKFLQDLNCAIYSEYPEALTIFETPRAYKDASKPVTEGGLGFKLECRTEFSDGIYGYIATDPVFRKYKHSSIASHLDGIRDGNYSLSLTLDKRGSSKGTLIDKAFGSYEDKFKTLRTLLMLLITYPGKKEMFMGGEYAQFKEWYPGDALEWFLLDYPLHSLYREYVQAINRFYLTTPELYENDSISGFSRISFDEKEKCSVAFRRYSLNGDFVTVLLNFSGIVQSFFFDVTEDERLLVLFKSVEDGDLRIEYIKLDEGKRLAKVELPPIFGVILREGGNKKIIKV